MPAYPGQLGNLRCQRPSQGQMHQYHGLLLWYVEFIIAKIVDFNLCIIVVAGVNILVDIWIIGLPIKTLSGIKRPKRDKIVLFVVFGVGGFSCISRLVHLTYSFS